MPIVYCGDEELEKPFRAYALLTRSLVFGAPYLHEGGTNIWPKNMLMLCLHKFVHLLHILSAQRLVDSVQFLNSSSALRI